MARKFIKRADIPLVAIPGVGTISSTQVLEGDQFAKFCPSLLREVLDAAPQEIETKLLVEISTKPENKEVLIDKQADKKTKIQSDLETLSADFTIELVDIAPMLEQSSLDPLPDVIQEKEPPLVVVDSDKPKKGRKPKGS